MDRRTEEIMDEVYFDFKRRAKEVRRYTDLILALADTRVATPSLNIGDAQFNEASFEIDRELNKTIRASGYLLLYNLVESTLSNAIDAIHRVVQDNNLEYEDLSRELKKVTLKNFKKIISEFSDSYIAAEHPIQLAMVKMGHSKDELFSGNVDCRKIRDISKQYGFSPPDPKSKGRHIGDLVLEVKNRRNALAHGSLSFEQCGRETSPERIKIVTDQTITYLRGVLWSISFYLRKQQYQNAAN